MTEVEMTEAATLEAILGRDDKEVAAALVAELPARCGSKPLVLFGAGPLGRIALDGLERAGIRPLALCDNSVVRQGHDIDGIPVLSPVEAVTLHGREAAFVVTVYNPSGVVRQLEELGAGCVVTAAPLFRHYHEALAPHGSFDLPHQIFSQANDVRRMGQLWADDESRREYLAQLEWRTTVGYSDMPPPSPGDQTYFPPDLVALSAEERFVDCGAFDGDTLRAFLQQSRGSFARFDAFEPDPDNCARLKSFISLLPAGTAAKIEVRNAAVGARSELVAFHVTGTAGSGIKSDGTFEVDCVRLDDVLGDLHPTYIKMDIEGAEPDALQGARQLLQREQPVLAVCTYHSMDHLWRLPLLIHEINPDYRLYLRRYAEECWETVCYAVPPQRALR
jgi:FkbM family methyltransferase